ncbi:MAG: Pr6Pr family membrane protein [Coriobacteriales bacterium]|jgi:hypothetical protein|nr:Pr6Pr family membrane protein [Coriobacteriales bacterium]
MIQDRRIALVLRVIFAVLTLMGLFSYIGVFQGTFRPSLLMYYTIQSNILALGLFLGLAVRTAWGIRQSGVKGSAGYAPRFELVCTIDLLLTLVVFWVMLAPSMFTMGDPSGLATYENYQVHLLTPLFCLIDWVLFAPSRTLRFRNLFLIYIFPYCYVIFTSIAGLMGYEYRYGENSVATHYPYFFFDYDLVGWYALLYIAALSAFFFIIGCLFYLFDRKFKKPRLFAGPDRR